MSGFVQQSATATDFATSDSWVILSPIEQSIKRKIESVGTPLKDWDIQINYGIKTGYNDAFIISTERRDEILANCTSEEERERTAELIRPILRGRDIKRYSYDWADLWLINTHNGVRGKYDRIHIEDYPAIKAHLDQFWDKISTRADKGDTPYNLRNCAYLDYFFQPKIVYMEIQTDNPSDGYPFPCFSFDQNKSVVLNTGYIMSSETVDVKYILGVLNSTTGRFITKMYVSQLQSRQYRMLAQFVGKFPVPQPVGETEAKIAKCIDQILGGDSTNEHYLNAYVYELFNFNMAEIEAIENFQ